LQFFDSPERAVSTMRKSSLVWKAKSAKIEYTLPTTQFP
jgi:hypothetical protein